MTVINFEDWLASKATGKGSAKYKAKLDNIEYRRKWDEQVEKQKREKIVSFHAPTARSVITPTDEE